MSETYLPDKLLNEEKFNDFLAGFSLEYGEKLKSRILESMDIHANQKEDFFNNKENYSTQKFKNILLSLLEKHNRCHFIDVNDASYVQIKNYLGDNTYFGEKDGKKIVYKEDLYGNITIYLEIDTNVISELYDYQNKWHLVFKQNGSYEYYIIRGFTSEVITKIDINDSLHSNFKKYLNDMGLYRR